MLTQRINLLKLKNAFVAKLTGKSGQKKNCLVIPLDESGLYAGEKGVYLDTVLVESPNNAFGDSHLREEANPHPGQRPPHGTQDHHRRPHHRTRSGRRRFAFLTMTRNELFQIFGISDMIHLPATVMDVVGKS